MILPFVVIGTLVALAVIVMVLADRVRRGRGMSIATKLKVGSALEEASAHADPVRRIIAMDAVLDLALKELGFAGSLGDKLKKAGPRIPNIQAVWEAHKFRNKLAHEHGATPNPAEVDRAVRIFAHAIMNLSK